MLRWFTNTRQGQIVSFLIILFIVASLLRSQKTQDSKETTGRSASAQAPPPEAPKASDENVPGFKPEAPAPNAAANWLNDFLKPKSAELEGLINDLSDPCKTKVAKAQDKLVEIGKPAVARLVESLYSLKKEAKVQAGWALIRIGEPSVKPLLDELTVCEEKEVQNLIKRILQHIGPAVTQLKKIRCDAKLQKAAEEILAEIQKDKLSESDAVSAEDATIAEELTTYEKALAEYRQAAKNLRKMRTALQMAAKAALLTHSGSWRNRVMMIRAEIETGEKALAELDLKVKSAKEKIPDPPS